MITGHIALNMEWNEVGDPHKEVDKLVIRIARRLWNQVVDIFG